MSSSVPPDGSSDPTLASRPALALSAYLGSALLVGGLLSLAAAWVNHENLRESFPDDLGNEIVIGADTTLLLVVLGVLLLLHGSALLLWRAASSPRRR